MALTRVRWTRTALADFSERGRRGRVDGTRELVIHGLPFIIVYRISPDGIDLLTVVHGAQQYPP